MRLWSIHPKYLDGVGLVACWREGLLAKAVLEGKTKGYKNHPQLSRFSSSSNPVGAINDYLRGIVEEAERRGYNFDRKKLSIQSISGQLEIADQQIRYEADHLLTKLKKRSPKVYVEYRSLSNWDPHPLFKVIDGAIADWEKPTTTRDNLM